MLSQSQTVCRPAARMTARFTAVLATCTLYALPLIGFAARTAASPATAAVSALSVFQTSARSASSERQGTGATAPSTTRAERTVLPFITSTTVLNASGQSRDCL